MYTHIKYHSSLEVALWKSCFHFQNPVYHPTTAYCLLSCSVPEGSFKIDYHFLSIKSGNFFQSKKIKWRKKPMLAFFFFFFLFKEQSLVALFITRWGLKSQEFVSNHILWSSSDTMMLLTKHTVSGRLLHSPYHGPSCPANVPVWEWSF